MAGGEGRIESTVYMIDNEVKDNAYMGEAMKQ